MRRCRRIVTLTGLAVALFVLVVSGSATAAPPTGTGTVPAADNATAAGQNSSLSVENELLLTKELELTPTRPGEVTVTLRYETPSNLAGLRVELPGEPTVTETRGFDRRDGEYVWNERLSTPSLTYRLPVNETDEAAGPLAGSGDYLFVDTGPWALVRIPQVTTTGSRYRGEEITFSKSTVVAGSGTVGESVAFLGAYREHQRTAHGQTFRLVVPDRADLAEPPAAILDAVAETADAMRVGDRDASVFMVAAPTDTVEWAVDGLQTGGSDLWARDRSRLDSADNVWVHEYVHTRQDYEPASETRWFTEASATYYAALFALEQDRIDYRTFRTRLALGERPSHAEAILSDTSTWAGVAPYTKGALVVGELDRQTRLATAGTSFQSVFRRVNAHEGVVLQSDLRAVVRAVAGSQVAALSDRYTTTTAVPSMWDRGDHRRAFDTRLPHISAGFDDPSNASAFRVAGPYRTGAVAGRRPIRLATGETLTADVVVSNTGSAAGEYDLRARLDSATIARPNGTLAANATTRWPVSHTFESAGEYALTVGDAQVRIAVSPPATATVTGLTADTTGAVVGDTVTLTGTVRNDDSVPAATNLTLRRDGVPIETRRVVLAPGTNGSITFEQSFDAAGSYRFRLDGQQLTVSVREPSTPTATRTTGPATGSTGTTSGSGDGFGVALTVAVLALCSVAAGRRRRGQ